MTGGSFLYGRLVEVRSDLQNRSQSGSTYALDLLFGLVGYADEFTVGK